MVYSSYGQLLQSFITILSMWQGNFNASNVNFSSNSAIRFQCTHQVMQIIYIDQVTVTATAGTLNELQKLLHP